HEHLRSPWAGDLQFETRLHLRGGKSKAVVLTLDRRDVGVELCGRKRLCVAQAEARLELGQRERGIAGDFDARDALERTFAHREGNEQVAIGLFARMRRSRVAVALRPK